MSWLGLTIDQHRLPVVFGNPMGVLAGSTGLVVAVAPLEPFVNRFWRDCKAGCELDFGKFARGKKSFEFLPLLKRQDSFSMKFHQVHHKQFLSQGIT